MATPPRSTQTLAPFARRRAAHLALGRRGERAAVRLLRECGLDVLCTNYRGPAGELDIVARDGTTLCFVEVKTRRSNRRATPGEAVNRRKQKRIIRTARQFLRDLGRPPVRHRYDVVEVLARRGRIHSLRHLPTAFTEETPR